MMQRRSYRILFLNLAFIMLFLKGILAQVPKTEKDLSHSLRGVSLLRDLEYARPDGKPQLLDLYLPEKAERPLPLIVWIHGGAWKGGDKHHTPAVPLMTDQGYAVASINYRLSHEAIFPAQIHDCKAAIRWLRANAEQYHLDQAHIGAWGSSAGGHLVALLGTTGELKALEGEGNNLQYSSRVQAVCDWFGPTDFLQMDAHALPDTKFIHDAPDSPESQLVGGPIQENKDKVAKANPITYISDDDPPFLIMHGQKDLLVPSHQSELLYDALRKAGIEVMLLRIEEAGHGGEDFRTPEVKTMIIDFFNKHLKKGVSTPGEKTEHLQLKSFQNIKRYIYKKTPEGNLSIDVHFPEGWKTTDRHPAIVFFFGGGWRTGTIFHFLPQAKYLASRGMVTARAEYRIKSRHGTTPDKCVEDGKSAVRWLRANAAKLGIDPQRIVASGGSAGGHVAACTWTVNGLEAEGENLSISSKPNLLVLFNPVLNCTSERHVKRIGSEKIAKLISPNLHLTKNTPPVVIFFGTKDRLETGGKEYVEIARKLGITAELYTAEDQSHGFFNRSPWLERTIYLMDQFLGRYGYLKGEPTVKLPAGKVEMKREN